MKKFYKFFALATLMFGMGTVEAMTGDHFIAAAAIGQIEIVTFHLNNPDGLIACITKRLDSRNKFTTKYTTVKEEYVEIMQFALHSAGMNGHANVVILLLGHETSAPHITAADLEKLQSAAVHHKHIASLIEERLSPLSKSSNSSRDFAYTPEQNRPPKFSNKGCCS